MPPKPRSEARRAPVQERSRVTVGAIQQAAAQILVKEGYPRATTSRIAELAGVSVGTLYQYFDSRDAVFDAVIEDLLSEVISVVGVALGAPGPFTFRERLHQTVTATLTVVGKHPQVLPRLDAIPESTFRARLVDAKAHGREVLRAFLALHPTEIAVPDLGLAARMLADFGEGVAYNLQADDDIPRLAEESTHLIVAYLRGGGRGRTGGARGLD